ncbi:hypothetical protein EMCRGX_G034331 [Ephydatia muelleri]
MRLDCCIWPQLTLVAAATLLVRSQPTNINTVHCNASISANETCVVPYRSTVWLHCPNDGRSPTGFESWWFGQKSVCGQPDCNINTATSATTGVYLCSAGAQSTYTVQLNVLAPPALSKVSTCGTSFSSFCKSPQPLITMYSSEMKATVYYKGTGNISVTWSKKSDTGIFKPFQCPSTNCVLDRRTPNQQSIAIKINKPFQIGDTGTYMANVSNEYGWNTSVTILTVTCDPTNPPQLPYLNRVTINPITMKRGTNQNISCSAEMDSNTNLIMCYQSADDNSTDCGICPAFTEGSCSPIQTKPHWKISSVRSYPLGPCKPQRTINAAIDGVQPSDAGLVSCYWSSTKDKIPYFSYNVSVVYVPPSPSPLLVAPSSQEPNMAMVTSLVIGMLMVVCLLSVCIIVGLVFRRRDIKPDAPAVNVMPQKCVCQIDRDSVPSSVSLDVACDEAVTNV